jgi:D-hexose-6-phosphate mutarotase
MIKEALHTYTQVVILNKIQIANLRDRRHKFKLATCKECRVLPTSTVTSQPLTILILKTFLLTLVVRSL